MGRGRRAPVPADRHPPADHGHGREHFFGGARRTQLPRLVRQLVTNPILLGIFVSVAVRLTGLAVPGPLKTMVDMLGDAASPCALFALGIALKRYGFGRHCSFRRDDGAEAAFASAARLCAGNARVHHAARLGRSGRPVRQRAMGLNAYLFAERYRSGVAITAECDLAVDRALDLHDDALAGGARRPLGRLWSSGPENFGHPRSNRVLQARP